MRVTTPLTLAPLFALSLSCGGQIGASDLENRDTGDDSVFDGESGTISEEDAVSAAAAHVGGTAKVIAQSGLNLRTGPSTGYRIILTMRYGSEVKVLAQANDWYSVNYNGTVGWSFGQYLTPLSSGGGGGGGNGNGSGGTPAPSGGSGVANGMERARSGVGFSYKWGGGCWNPGSSAHGACYGSCPNCSHSGQWGADCSGYVGKIWQVPGPVAVTTCNHPYSTYNFFYETTHWDRISRGNARQGDAFVRDGHIFLYDRGDPWGSMWAYEAKGCSYGIVHNVRTADSSYRVIRRRGW